MAKNYKITESSKFRYFAPYPENETVPLFGPSTVISVCLVDDTQIVNNIQLGQTVKVAIDYGRELASNYVLRIDDCSLVSAKQSLILIEKTQVYQTRV